ncbi:hypothetical protein BDB00DRAFT_857548 [Zychaea mexicana]|uniref:uncharacterized protein n=1 Tax=Zychaea mexicana TaxID=64656 RepID=UPI0022FEDF99|nr:uncharacterized protein BDB00DRAFT_857548 [Zychaea mexicana]KAI9482538.1 hypothetical protein BDB00DRAFT_857548 [Zychaea mexicana]
MLSSDDPHAVFVAGSNDNQYLQPNDPDKASNAPKKKSMERISKLFQKKPKKQQALPSSLTSSFSSVSLTSSNYEQPQQNHQAPPIVNSTKSTTSKRSSSLRIPFRGGGSGDSTKSTDTVNNGYAQQQPLEIRSSLERPPSMSKQDAPSLSKDDSSTTSNSVKAGDGRDDDRTSISITSPSGQDCNGSNCNKESTPVAAGDTIVPLAAATAGASTKRTMSTRSTASSAAGGKGTCVTSVVPLKAQLERQKRILENLQVEQQHYEKDNKVLSEKLDALKAKYTQRAQDMKQLQENFDEYLKALRATGDDLDSVGEKIENLKQDIRDLASILVERGDAEAATKALSTFWLNLNTAIVGMGSPLPKHRLQMLTEKFMMDVLVQNLNLNVFPGVDNVDEYNRLQYWLEDNISDQHAFFPVRLRQETALMVVKKEMDKDSDVHRSRHTTLQNNWKYLYSGIVKAFPFVYQHDKAEADVRKHYGAKVQLLVEQAINLGLAIKGQELDVTAAAVTEGEQAFDPEIMEDEDGQTSGTVGFCICPPFVVGNPAPIRTLIKGRVLCNPPNNPASR